MNHELAELYGEPSILTVAKAGACHEDIGLMPINGLRLSPAAKG